MKRLRNIKKRTIIILVILFVFIITAGVLAYKNRNTIQAIYYVATKQTAHLEQKKLDTDQKAVDAIKEFGIEDVRSLTEEETKKLSNGEITEQQAVDIVLGKPEEPAVTADSGENSGNTGEQQPEPAPVPDAVVSDETKAKNDEIAQLIGEMYVLKAKFSGDLSAIESWVKGEYWVYTLQYGEGNVPSSIKMKIGREAYAKATALEVDCDSKVNAILSRITTLLTETGQSTKLVDEIRAAYDNEKMLAKSYYMSQI